MRDYFLWLSRLYSVRVYTWSPLFFLGNPIVITASGPVVLREGDQDNSRPVLVALVSGTPYPQPSNISWRFNNSRSLPDDVVENGHELLLPGIIRPEIEGVYTCNVTTSAGSDSTNISVRLIRKSSHSYSSLWWEIFVSMYIGWPSVSLSPSISHSVQVNSSITLVCNDRRGLPPPTFMWTFNGSNLTTGIVYFQILYIVLWYLSFSLSLSLWHAGNHISRVDQRASPPYSSSLTIDQFQPSHSGEYKCIASNDAGSSYRAVTLSVRQPSEFQPVH